jgi:hypothetical protein
MISVLLSVGLGKVNEIAFVSDGGESSGYDTQINGQPNRD